MADPRADGEPAAHPATRPTAYRERPSHRLPGAVVWTRADVSADPVRVVPDGCMDLIAVDGRLIVAGPDTRAHLVEAVPGAVYTGVRFLPGTGAALLGVRAHDLRDRRVPLEDLWPGRRARLAARRVAEAPRPGRALEEVVGGAVAADAYDPVAAAVLLSARQGEPVSVLAARLGLGERQVHRRSLHAFGYGPKTLARVLRANRALELARAGVRFADAAVTCGYADQAHLAREMRRLTGATLGALLRER
ncbi:helix-turn-helix domain-containing protein [Streptomyces huiliensis]|uniref:helix-turn-helix domain-containing protein n=1 Tax=Streptomyces huiliensis TaxID=2876027 RepID=UPI0027E0F3DF|nr:helix-turn-helix domain-containing protein [Streptomyces huiliensis]MBZ4321630.1 helix-turn-helix domain-containing protein [Streptomyces huiliensis]